MVSGLRVHNGSLLVRTRPKALHDVTADIRRQVDAAGCQNGLCTLFVRHTSASLLIQENADPDVLADLEVFLSRLVPETAHYAHHTEGTDDMPAHIRSALTQTSLGIPIVGGALALGTWQAVYLWEHRAAAHERNVLVTIVGA